MDAKDKAQAELRECGIKAGQIYRHYRGGLYSVVAMAIQEEPPVPLVVYQSNAKGTIWVRTLENFRQRVMDECALPTSRFVRELD